MNTLFDVGDVRTERCCKTCAHAEKRHGVVRKCMHPLVCLLYAKPVPYVCGDGQNGITPRYPCHVVIDAVNGPIPAGWEAARAR